MSHLWNLIGESRTIVWYYETPDEIVQYLKDMQDAIRYAFQVDHRDAIRDEKRRAL
jgi:hypothetical protein